MLLAAVEKALTAFVTSEERTTIALKGPWGRGKTHYWNRFMRRHAKDRPTQGYAYVSLFGMTSLPELRRAVAMNAKSLSMIGDGPTPGYVEEAIAMTWRERTANELLSRNKPYADVLQNSSAPAAILDELLQTEVKDLIVCVDDLERRGDSLRLADVLGYCSHLKERRGCRVVVVLNEDAFDDADAEEFARLSEKVFDHRVLFEPDARECVGIVMPEGESRFEGLREDCIRLRITNIRILQRARKLVADFAPYAKQYDSRIARQIAHTGALLTLCYYGRSDEIPPVEFVARFRDPARASRDGASLPSADERRWEAMLAAYGFNGMDGLDREVLKYLEHGYVDGDRVRALLDVTAKDLVIAQRKQRFDDAWAALCGSFDAGERKVLDELEHAMANAAEMIDATYVNAAAQVMRRVGLPEAAARVIAQWVETVSEKAPGALEAALHTHGAEVTDQDLRAAIQGALRLRRDARTLEQVLEYALVKGEVPPEIVGTLAAAPASEYEQLFRRWRDNRLESAIEFCVNLPPDGEAHVEARRRALDALRTIAADSPMNAWRVSRFVKL